jgi:hypothetical protein
MANRNDVHELPFIVDRIHYPILADSNPPEMALPSQFAAAPGTWLFRQRFDPRQNSVDERRLQLFQFSSSRARKCDGVLSH